MDNQELVLEKFRIGKGQSLELWVSKNDTDFFSPNYVSGFLADQVKVKPNDVIFEIGSGISPISILLANKQPGVKHIYCVEIVPEQIKLALQNIAKYGLELKITPILGSLFTPLRDRFPNMEADVIVDDCSGLSPVAKELGWYPKGDKIPQGGSDGTDMVIPFLKSAGSYLSENGKVYFPTTPNFSDEKKIIDTAQKYFSKVELLLEEYIPLTTSQTNIISKTQESNIFEPIMKKGTRGLWTVKVWKASKPNRVFTINDISLSSQN